MKVSIISHHILIEICVICDLLPLLFLVFSYLVALVTVNLEEFGIFLEDILLKYLL